MSDRKSLQKHMWKEEYSVNITEIDDQHKKFIEILNILIDIINEGQNSNRVADLFFSLAYYAEHYFINEEIFFAEYKYPKLIQHKEHHDKFIKRIIRFQKEFEQEREYVCEQLFAYLESWFYDHILQYDKDAAVFLKDNGMK